MKLRCEEGVAACDKSQPFKRLNLSQWRLSLTTWTFRNSCNLTVGASSWHAIERQLQIESERRVKNKIWGSTKFLLKKSNPFSHRCAEINAFCVTPSNKGGPTTNRNLKNSQIIYRLNFIIWHENSISNQIHRAHNTHYLSQNVISAI